MNDTQNSYLDPDEQRRLQDIDPDKTIPPRGTPRPQSTQYRSSGFPPLPEEPERIPTPRSFPPVSTMSQPPPPRRGPSFALGCLTGLALFLALLSVLLNVILLSTLSNAQRAAVENIDAVIQALDGFLGEGFYYEYKFNRDIPVAASIPIQQQMTIPFEGNFPINTTIEVPIDAGLLGTFVVDVPINTNVYVSTQVPVNIDQTFDFSSTIPISMTVPINVSADDPEIEDLIGRARQWLIDLRDSLSRGWLPDWLPLGDE
ncbi:MAG: hypothetical protein JXA93_14305 [Anaerolineae bacterium]|nr:hypothetical protein [Anaerolineae bacterium]